MSFEIPCEGEALAALLEQADRFSQGAGLSPTQCHHVRLIIDELVTNALTHGKTADSKTVSVRLSFDGRELVIDLHDQGQAFDPNALKAPDLDADLESRAVGGLGVYLAKSLSDSLSYRREANGNHLTIRKTIR